ncbi:hypothetical protein D5F01_LYC07637 [Larimichthys crocea]|uniref:Uncharacterized protein n=1 Tax=Larimichthys crocea TaxID=215358 RepID=A0A6G0ITV9_LARCR|nr:hypothetical protein D5F01_LYC07637 [Larimichthys crocea]
MMSAAQSPTTPKSKLEALQCHFTWDLDWSRFKLFRLRDNMKDIGTRRETAAGHIYNLQGFIQYKLGFTEDAQSLFNKAAEAFSQTRGAAEGPCAAQSPTTPKSKLEALQCHFTWDLDRSRSKPFCLRDSIEDIGTEEGNSWLGHIYNLQGFIQYKLGFTEDAQSLFNKAAEAFSQTRGAAEGPWLVVNYGNLAWLHHHLGDQAESQAYLSKVDALMEKYPSPSQDELHPEIYAEKAWTLMKFSTDKRLLAADYFQRAIRMQPDMVEWNTSRILALVTAANHNKEEELGADVFEKMRIAKNRIQRTCTSLLFILSNVLREEKESKMKHVSYPERF